MDLVKKKFDLSIKQFDIDEYSIMWKNKKVPKETIITMLEAFLTKFKEDYREELMGNTKPF